MEKSQQKAMMLARGEERAGEHGENETRGGGEERGHW